MRAFLERIPADAARFFTLKRRTDPAFEFYWHQHEEYELTLIVRSDGRRFVGDHLADYQGGDLVLLGPNLPHTWCSAPADAGVHEAIVVQFGPDLVGPGRLDGPRLGTLRSLFDRCARGVQFVGGTREDVAARLLALEGLSPVRQLGELLVILDLLATSQDGVVLSSRTFAPQPQPADGHPIDKVCRFLNDRYLDPVSLGQASRVLAMSPSAFSRFFRRTTGKTFTGYLNELRLGHACRLLMETERGIADIADASGFPNLSHFNRQFLRLKKMRPSEYRRAFHRFRAPGADRAA